MLRPLALEAFEIAFSNELAERKLPWLLLLGGQGNEFLWIQSQLARHLNFRVAQLEPAPRVKPRLKFWWNFSHSNRIYVDVEIADVGGK